MTERTRLIIEEYLASVNVRNGRYITRFGMQRLIAIKHGISPQRVREILCTNGIKPNGVRVEIHPKYFMNNNLHWLEIPLDK